MGSASYRCGQRPTRDGGRSRGLPAPGRRNHRGNALGASPPVLVWATRYRGFESPPLRFRKPRTAADDPVREAGFSRPSGEFGGKSLANSTARERMQTDAKGPGNTRSESGVSRNSVVARHSLGHVTNNRSSSPLNMASPWATGPKRQSLWTMLSSKTPTQTL